MRTITTRVRAVDFAEQMTAMRRWLDEHQFEPSQFKYSEAGDDILIDVSFTVAVEAAAFSARFNGTGIDATSASPPPIVERDISIGKGGDARVVRAINEQQPPMPANVIIVHDDPIFVTAVAVELRLADHHVVTFRDPLEALPVLETEQPFDVLITRMRFAPGRSNGIALAQMTRLKRPEIKVLFTVAPENIEYTEGLGEFLAAPIDIRELAAMVSKLSLG